ncbi:hypothetical protein YC2023_024465 [Brassica napus]
MCLGMTSSSKFRSLRDFDDMTRAAYLERGCPMAFETEGTVQEARGLASSKKTSLDDVIAAACMKLEEYTTAKEAQEKGASVAPNDINLV